MSEGDEEGCPIAAGGAKSVFGWTCWWRMWRVAYLRSGSRDLMSKSSSRFEISQTNFGRKCQIKIYC